MCVSVCLSVRVFVCVRVADAEDSLAQYARMPPLRTAPWAGSAECQSGWPSSVAWHGAWRAHASRPHGQRAMERQKRTRKAHRPRGTRPTRGHGQSSNIAESRAAEVLKVKRLPSPFYFFVALLPLFLRAVENVSGVARPWASSAPLSGLRKGSRPSESDLIAGMPLASHRASP